MSAIIGYGAHGQDIEAIFRRTQSGSLELFDDDQSRGKPIEGRINDYYLGPYYPDQKVAMDSRIKGRPGSPLIDPRAYIGRGCSLGPGVVIAANAFLDHSVVVGKHTHINYSASMTRTRIGDYCTISPGVVICGDVVIGHRVFVGAGAIVCNLVTIPDDSVIQAGQIVSEGYYRK